MSRRVIGLGYTNKKKGEKWDNNAIGGVGARNRAVRKAIQQRTGECCPNDPRLTRIETNPVIEVLIKGPLNKAAMTNVARITGDNRFLNPTKIVVGTEVTEIGSDILTNIQGKRLTTLGFKIGGTHKCRTI